MIHGRDCRVIFRLGDTEADVPYTTETLRGEVTVLLEQASIEGDGLRRGLRDAGGLAGCIVTPITRETAPLLLGLAFGDMGIPAVVSYGQSLHELILVPSEDGEAFEVRQERGALGKRFGGCRVTGFEIRISRAAGEEAVKLKLELAGEERPEEYAAGNAEFNLGERYKERGVSYFINGKQQTGINALTLRVTRTGGVKAEAVLHRALGQWDDREAIEELVVEARLFRGENRFGLLRLIMPHLVLVADETAVQSAGPVTGPLRYFVAGLVRAEVFA